MIDIKTNKMEKTKKDNGNWKGREMPLDEKSNEDFNSQHPDHDENGLINADAITEEKNKGNDSKQTSETITKETKSEKTESVKTYMCSMHLEVISNKTGNCPKCGMELIEKIMV